MAAKSVLDWNKLQEDDRLMIAWMEVNNLVHEHAASRPIAFMINVEEVDYGWRWLFTIQIWRWRREWAFNALKHRAMIRRLLPWTSIARGYREASKDGGAAFAAIFDPASDVQADPL